FERFPPSWEIRYVIAFKNGFHGHTSTSSATEPCNDNMGIGLFSSYGGVPCLQGEVILYLYPL
ncbi:hypothetical protein NAH08_09765, partial [Francisella tularensis subsp. holarctica]|uniref:hypothetical protein n=1 Tax=Francisella tularensis TaxID=263 RepID=UPI002381BBCD